MAVKAAVFLDKDGTLLEDVPYNADPARMKFMPRAADGLRMLARLGRPLIVISNQAGIAMGKFAPDALQAVEQGLRQMFAEAGASLAGFYWCPHHPEGTVARYTTSCMCRKPMPGLLRQAAREHEIDLVRSWFIGDILDDIEAGRRANCRTILLDNGHETMWSSTPATVVLRAPHYRCGDLAAAARIIVDSPAGLPAWGERA
ncbi:MAG: Hydrolase, HAD-superfamily, subfamily [Bradyrhizobium sp.]|nr:Hydrolase, HAD-superfamily, subfamily [Bradyrhizobium sp.]